MNSDQPPFVLWPPTAIDPRRIFDITLSGSSSDDVGFNPFPWPAVDELGDRPAVRRTLRAEEKETCHSPMPTSQRRRKHTANKRRTGQTPLDASFICTYSNRSRRYHRREHLNRHVKKHHQG